MDGERLLKILNDALNGYEGAVGSVEKKIEKKVKFDFSIIYHSSDGFNLLNSETANVAPFEACVDMINRDGCLTVENHKSICI